MDRCHFFLIFAVLFNPSPTFSLKTNIWLEEVQKKNSLTAPDTKFGPNLFIPPVLPVYYAPRVFHTSKESLKVPLKTETLKKVDVSLDSPILSQPTGSSRQKRLQDVSLQLKSSIKTKQQAENMIAEEIGNLRVKIASELEEEVLLRNEITYLVEALEKSISEKKVQVTEEEEVLRQIQVVNSQVKEQRIFNQIDEAAARKANLISIEASMLEDLEYCREQMTEELQDTIVRIDRMKGTLEKLPLQNDIQSSRAYSWTDVQDLQDMLTEALDSLQERDAKIGQLKVKFSNATRQKAIALGDVDVITIDSTDEPMFNKFSETPLSEVQTDLKPKQSVKVTISPEMTNDDLLKLAGNSSLSAVQESARAVTIFSSRMGDWIKSEEAQQSASNLIDALEATKNVVPSLLDAVQSAKAEWDANFKGEEMTTFDKLFGGLLKATLSIINSEDVNKALNKAGSSSKEFGQKTALASKTTFGAIQKSASDETLLEALSKALEDLQKTIISLAAAGTKLSAKLKSDRLLPPSK